MNDLLDKLQKVEKLAYGSKLTRLLANPYKYLTFSVYNNVFYKLSKRGIKIKTKIFFGKKMIVELPASTDIYITGGKSHDSEIRLAKYLIKNLKPQDTFIDIGAHFGYFSLLASELVGQNGMVISFEPANRSFRILKKNTELSNNIQIFNNIVSDKNEPVEFYEFPIIYSEYNAMDIDQYSKEKWFANAIKNKSKVMSVTLDNQLKELNLSPNIMKIDVEGAEYKVILGATNILKDKSPVVVMEYLSSSRKNSNHIEAVSYLVNIGYQCFIIDKNGNLKPQENLENYLKEKKLESDNIVFIKR